MLMLLCTRCFDADFSNYGNYSGAASALVPLACNEEILCVMLDLALMEIKTKLSFHPEGHHFFK